ncbi:hypothetical protein F5887DRAFT_920216 [Amanita rubescens]|nr:hypothetical protein F5887DRAFT_920216 [Amanita rubescens]
MPATWSRDNIKRIGNTMGSVSFQMIKLGEWFKKLAEAVTGFSSAVATWSRDNIKRTGNTMGSVSFQATKAVIKLGEWFKKLAEAVTRFSSAVLHSAIGKCKVKERTTEGQSYEGGEDV